MKYWRGDYVIVFPGSRTKFHRCVVCGRSLRFDAPASDTGVGPECARKPTDVIANVKEKALEGDRRRYRAEVIGQGFTIQ